MKFDIYGDTERGYSGSAIYEPGVDMPLAPCPLCLRRDLEVLNTHTPSYWISCGCGIRYDGTPARITDPAPTEAIAKKRHRDALNRTIREWNMRG